MLVSATREASRRSAVVIFYAALFGFVVVLHVALTTALRAMGWNGGASLLASGAIVLLSVLTAVGSVDRLRARAAASREAERARQGLPEGPCCVVWPANESSNETAMPWRPVSPLRPRYPKLARHFGVEGVAVVEFEINARGEVKHLSCHYSWPSEVFYEAAREAVLAARFEPKPGAKLRFGVIHRLPFVFRIAGAAAPRRRLRSQRVYSASGARRAAEARRSMPATH